MNWTPEIIARLRELWAAGVPTIQIARELGTTKNAIIGNAHRLYLDNRPSPIQPRTGPRPVKRTKAPRKTLPPFVQEVPVIRSDRQIPLAMPEPAVVIQFPATRGQCEWLDGDHPRTFVRCTEPALFGKSWCACHHRIVFVRRRDAA